MAFWSLSSRFLSGWECVALAGSAALLLSACSGNPLPAIGSEGGTATGSLGLSLASVTGYSSANAIITTGYSDTELAPGHVEIRVKGSIVTPPERLEKIALARAAEIGVEQKSKYFKTAAFAHSVMCKDARGATHKGGKSAPDLAPLAVVDVVYAKDAADPSYLPSSETFDRLSAELAQEVFSAEAKSATAAAIQAKCGK